MSLLLALSNHCHVLMTCFNYPAFERVLLTLHNTPSPKVPFSSCPNPNSSDQSKEGMDWEFSKQKKKIWEFCLDPSGRGGKSRPRSRREQQEPFWGGFGDSFSPRAFLGFFLVPGKTQMFKFWLYSSAGSNRDRLFLVSPDFWRVGLQREKAEVK